MTIVIESARVEGVRAFWDAVLGGDAVTGPGVVIEESPLVGEPARDVVHLDVARPGAEAAAEALRLETGRPAGGPYGIGHIDADGHPVDLLGDGALTEDDAVSDWRALFAAMVAYRGAESALAEVAEAAAVAAAEHGIPLITHLTPDLLVLDSGKDRWESPEGGADPRFLEVASRAQAAARHAGLTPDPTVLRFVQLGIDALDVAATRAFWAAALALRPDPRPGLSDLVDPLDRLPVLFFQPIEDPDEPRGTRVRFEVTVPAVELRERVRLALAAGGRRLDPPQSDVAALADSGDLDAVVLADPGDVDAVVLADPGGIRLVLRADPAPTTS